jgi:tRNA threonylcarbamoyladenosine biosynthesis protein TsaE
MKYISRSTEDTQKLAEAFISSLEQGEHAVVVALEGDLGAGKTAFSQYIGEALGVHDPIQSPTFLIEKIYELRKKPWNHLVHIDAYRLENEQELLDLGWQDIVSRPENLILVEWAGKVKNILPEDAIHIGITHVDETTREFEITEGETRSS